METQNLQAASDYLNNLLLARGLLHNGKPIDFAGPGEGQTSDAEDKSATMGRIINLVHDLVTRRDREAEQRESLANTVRTLRNTESRQTVEIDRLETKASDLARSLALAEGQERTFKTTIREAEATAKTLRDQMQRMKSSIHQIRSQSANDLRKRDVEMQKLKTHMAERQRGKRDGLGVTTITVTPPPKNLSCRSTAEGGQGLDVPGYSLRQETTEFLTQLCQNLSDENDALISISKNSIQTLRSLQGLSDIPEQAADGSGSSKIGNPEHCNSFQNDNSSPPHQCEALSREMDFVLEQLRALLTNPSFVPLEEVELRDNEISRLREGWEEMEARWREAVRMMDGWHKRISHGGASINIDELKQGIGLGRNFDWQRNSVNYGVKLNAGECAGNDKENEPIRHRTSTDGDDSMEISVTKPMDSVGHIGPPAEKPFTQSPGRNRRRKRSSLDPEPSHQNEEEEEKEGEDGVLVNKPNLANVQQRPRRRRADSKISKLPTTKKPTVAGNSSSRKPAAHVADGRRRVERNKRRSSSFRAVGQRARRRSNSLRSRAAGTGS